ncbi:DUF1896 domain-containing protein [Elizabethkingia anophelis]|uniref:DUF1896 domain-containing protein n=2 Tax=Elizabethkingia anophelis TaxID=1117645 RepID=A0A455ZF53_9FLAO|nr:DUF1896 domain-containing protein [Elizabethkingia anophelis]AIL46939.1 hypothetical protein BD94_3164 [Elizabethkingia anophelis NUHP1]DAC75390.1 TPA_exp: hypothetical protein [Elizabethkingia anophelis]
MNKEPKDQCYFRLRLQELLNTSFPEKATDQKFIEQRSARAANAYEGAFLGGNTVEQCNEIANFILFEGLYFSKFDTIFQVVCQEFDTIMADEELRPFALKIFPLCEPVFERYELTDDFAYTTDCDRLYTELSDTITTWIRKNGL